MNGDPAKWGDYIEDEFQISSKRTVFRVYVHFSDACGTGADHFSIAKGHLAAKDRLINGW